MSMTENRWVRSEEPVDYNTQSLGCTTSVGTDPQAVPPGVRGRLDHLIELSEMICEEANSNWTPIKAIENIITPPEPQGECKAADKNPEPETTSINGKIIRIQKLLEQAVMSIRMQHDRLNEITQTKL